MVRWLKASALRVAGAYAAFVAIEVLFLLAFGASFVGGLLLRSFFGLEAEPFLPIASLFQRLGNSDLFVSLAAVGSTEWVLRMGSGAVDRALARAPLGVVPLALSAVVSIAGFVDARYGVSPLAKWLPAPPAEGHELASGQMALADVVHFTGHARRIETVGVLAYQAGLRRFVLEDPEGRVPSVKLDLYERRKLFSISFAELRSAGDASRALPDLHARVAPWLGMRVQVAGSATNAAIRAHVSDVRLAAALQDAEPSQESRGALANEAPAEVPGDRDASVEPSGEFVAALWPGEGIPRLRARVALPLYETPVAEFARPGSTLPEGTSFGADAGTLLVTRKAAALSLPNGLDLVARGYGPRRVLSRDDYYDAGRSASIRVEPGEQIEVLQYRAEGEWIFRHAGEVYAAHCDLCASVAPEVEWWVFVDGPGDSGWVRITEHSVEVLDRAF